MVDCQDEHEWVLVIDIDVTACDTETFGSFVSFSWLRAFNIVPIYHHVNLYT